MASKTGIEVRHRQACASRGGGRCSCSPSYRALVWDNRAGRQMGRTFHTRGEAVAWRQEASVALRRGTLVAPSKRTISEAAEELLSGMESGAVLNRSGNPYKPAARRKYGADLGRHVLPRLGTRRLSAVARRDVQDLVDDLRARGLAPSTVVGALDPLRVIFRRALQRDEIAVDPTKGLVLPAVRGHRDRIESPEAAATYVAALPPSERAVWACAFYAGLRRGELQALRWSDVDLETDVIRVERAWDDQGGMQAPKSDAGRRRVPLASPLRRELVEHKLRTGRDAADLVFGREGGAVFVPSTLRARANRAWSEAGLVALTLHEARHCCASYFIAAGMNLKQISVWIGHSTVGQTTDRYGHLIPGGEAEATSRLDAYLSRVGG